MQRRRHWQVQLLFEMDHEAQQQNTKDSHVTIVQSFKSSLSHLVKPVSPPMTMLVVLDFFSRVQD